MVLPKTRGSTKCTRHKMAILALMFAIRQPTCMLFTISPILSLMPHIWSRLCAAVCFTLTLAYAQDSVEQWTVNSQATHQWTLSPVAAQSHIWPYQLELKFHHANESDGLSPQCLGRGRPSITWSPASSSNFLALWDDWQFLWVFQCKEFDKKVSPSSHPTDLQMMYIYKILLDSWFKVYCAGTC